MPDENPSGLGIFDLPLRLPGQYFDKETNLHYNYFRDYDPSIGRYGESDPIGLKGGLNTYAYAGANPISRIDALGLDYISMYPMMLNPPQQQSCGCPAQSTSSKSQAAGQALGGLTAAGGGIGAATGLGLGIAATSTELGSAVGFAGAAGAAAVAGKATITGLVLGGAAGACVGIVVAGVIYFSSPQCTPCSP